MTPSFIPGHIRRLWHPMPTLIQFRTTVDSSCVTLGLWILSETSVRTTPCTAKEVLRRLLSFWKRHLVPVACSSARRHVKWKHYCAKLRVPGHRTAICCNPVDMHLMRCSSSIKGIVLYSRGLAESSSYMAGSLGHIALGSSLTQTAQWTHFLAGPPLVS